MSDKSGVPKSVLESVPEGVPEKDSDGISDKVQYIIGAVISVVLLSAYLILGQPADDAPGVVDVAVPLVTDPPKQVHKDKDISADLDKEK